ncbi:MAG: hypothetical protein VCA36_03225, partial [Opitutales bacterium]
MGRFSSANNTRAACLAAISFLLVASLFQLTTEANPKPSGKLRGILTAKSSAWIEIKVDGESTPRRLIPTWRGGLPKQGGGLDDYVLNKIK